MVNKEEESMADSSRSNFEAGQDDEIDLRVYINTLMHHKWIILGLTLISGLATFVIVSLSPPTYQATALVAITRPLYQFQFTPNIPNITDKESTQQFTGKAGVELATSDNLLQQALNVVGQDIKPQDRSLVSFKNKIKVSTSTDPSILKFTATNGDPLLSMKIANTTADLYVRYVNELYGQSTAQEKFFEQQLTQVRNDLNNAEQALIEFQKRNNLSILSAQLINSQNTFNAYLVLKDSQELLLLNIRGFQNKLTRQPADNRSALVDDLTELLMQTSAFSTPQGTLMQISPMLQGSPQAIPQAIPQGISQGISQGTLNTQPAPPIQLQVSAAKLPSKTVGQQVAYLNELAISMEAKRAEVQRQLKIMPKNILTLQGQLQKITTESTELNRKLNFVQTVYNSLAQKAGETRIASQETSGRVRLASYSATPDRPMGRGRLQTTAIAMILAFFISICGVFIYEFFRKPREKMGSGLAI